MTCSGLQPGHVFLFGRTYERRKTHRAREGEARGPLPQTRGLALCPWTADEPFQPGLQRAHTPDSPRHGGLRTRHGEAAAACGAGGRAADRGPARRPGHGPRLGGGGGRALRCAARLCHLRTEALPRQRLRGLCKGHTRRALFPHPAPALRLAHRASDGRDDPALHLRRRGRAHLRLHPAGRGHPHGHPRRRVPLRSP